MHVRVNVPSAAIGAVALALVLLAASAAAPQSVATALATLLRVRVVSPVKILGQPAASEWIDIESNQHGQAATQYVVPSGKVLTIEAWWNSETDAALKMEVEVRIDGVAPGQVNTIFGRDMVKVIAANSGGVPAFAIAREGQIVEVSRTDTSVGTAWSLPEERATLRGWLEDIRY